MKEEKVSDKGDEMSIVRKGIELLLATACITFMLVWSAMCISHDKVPTNARYDTMPITTGDDRLGFVVKNGDGK
jgi:hypothetical protein